MTDRALGIVRDFIVERKLILFGGLAIDYALRLKGASLYPDGKRPDFDVLSPRNVDDAYDIADILHSTGFENVGVVRALHVQTMRVRADYVWVFDIGYAPPDVFGSLPTIEYRGMKVIHPDFQRMDIHLAFCFPFNDPPREDVFHRWRKDLSRLNLLETYYPISATGVDSAPGVVSVRFPVPVVGRARDMRVALHGFAAYSVLRTSLDEVAESFGVAAQFDMPRLALTFPDDDSVTLEVPVGGLVHAASPEPEALVGRSAVRWHEPYLDLCPESARTGDLLVVSTKNRLLATTVARVGGKQVQIVSPHYLLLYFLLEAHRADGSVRDAYRRYYLHTLAVVRAAESMYADRAKESSEPERARLTERYLASPFVPTTHTFGGANNSAAYMIKIATMSEKVRDSPPATLGLDPDIAELLVGLPRNYYPGTTQRQKQPFDYTANTLFHRSGRPEADGRLQRRPPDSS